MKLATSYVNARACVLIWEPFYLRAAPPPYYGICQHFQLASYGMEELLQPTHVELEIDSNPALTVDTNINSGT